MKLRRHARSAVPVGNPRAARRVRRADHHPVQPAGGHPGPRVTVTRDGRRPPAVLVALRHRCDRRGVLAPRPEPAHPHRPVFPLWGTRQGWRARSSGALQIAADLVNAEGGRRPQDRVDGARPASGDQAPAVMASAPGRRVTTVIGAIFSDLSVPPAPRPRRRARLLGAGRCRRLTGRGLPLVFRVGASGTNLGTTRHHSRCTARPRAGQDTADLRIAIFNRGDDYASSVADARRRRRPRQARRSCAALVQLEVPGYAAAS